MYSYNIVVRVIIYNLFDIIINDTKVNSVEFKHDV